MKTSLLLPLALVLVLWPAFARADDVTPIPTAASPRAEWARFGDFAHTTAFETNLLWPFFPGGYTDFKVVVPAVRTDRHAFRGEAIVGLSSDFASRIARDDSYGKVAILCLKLGWRQFIAYGLHVEATVNTGWREERANPRDGTTLESFVARLWLAAGWQLDLTPRVYLNLRGVLGIHLFRMGDKYADTERLLAGGADLNLGIRF